MHTVIKMIPLPLKPESCHHVNLVVNGGPVPAMLSDDKVGSMTTLRFPREVCWPRSWMGLVRRAMSIIHWSIVSCRDNLDIGHLLRVSRVSFQPSDLVRLISGNPARLSSGSRAVSGSLMEPRSEVSDVPWGHVSVYPDDGAGTQSANAGHKFKPFLLSLASGHCMTLSDKGHEYQAYVWCTDGTNWVIQIYTNR